MYHLPILFFLKKIGAGCPSLFFKKIAGLARGHGLQALRARAFPFYIYFFQLTPFYAF